MSYNVPYKKAYQSYSEQNYQDALDHINEAIKRLRRKSFLYKDDSKRKSELISAKMLKGRINLALGNTEKVRQIYNDIKQSIIGTDELSQQHLAKLNYYLAELEMKSGNKEKQVELLWNCKDNYEQAESYDEAIEVMFDLADIMEFENGKNGLVNHYRDLIELNKSVENKNMRRFNTAKARLEIGTLLRNGDPKVASQFLILAHKDFDKLDIPKLKTRAVLQLANVKAITDLDRGIEILETHLEEQEDKDNIVFKLAIWCKLSSLYLRANHVDRAEEYYEKIQSIGLEGHKNIDLANSSLEAAKSFLLTPDSEKLLIIAKDLANQSFQVFDKLNQKAGKAICYLIEGVASYLLPKENEDGSKLKLVHLLAKQIKDNPTYRMDSWTHHILQFLGDSEGDEERIATQLSLASDLPDVIEIAEIYHLIGLYKLSSTDKEVAKTYLNRSKSMYVEKSTKSNNFNKIADKIDQRVISI